MRIFAAFIIIQIFFLTCLFGQSGRVKNYSESAPQSYENTSKEKEAEKESQNENDEVIKISTELVLIPVQVSERKGRPITNLKQEEFKIFENGIEQEIAYFSDQEQPFSVALVLDMSYSSVFKLEEIQNAAMLFINQLRPEDKVMVISFDKEVRVLCELTNNRKILKLAVEGAKIASGTSLFSALDFVLNEKFSQTPGRKAIVLLSDGVDTTSRNVSEDKIVDSFLESDVMFYPIQYDTYDDVQKNRKKDAQILFDEDDRPYTMIKPREKGENESDYRKAVEFLKKTSEESGGKLFNASSTANLEKSFSQIADELRKIYSLGYYPGENNNNSSLNFLNIRVYRPKLNIRTKKIFKRTH